jgi:hypothetical protein
LPCHTFCKRRKSCATTTSPLNSDVSASYEKFADSGYIFSIIANIDISLIFDDCGITDGRSTSWWHDGKATLAGVLSFTNAFIFPAIGVALITVIANLLLWRALKKYRYLGISLILVASIQWMMFEVLVRIPLGMVVVGGIAELRRLTWEKD